MQNESVEVERVAREAWEATPHAETCELKLDLGARVYSCSCDRPIRAIVAALTAWNGSDGGVEIAPDMRDVIHRATVGSFEHRYFADKATALHAPTVETKRCPTCNSAAHESRFGAPCFQCVPPNEYRALPVAGVGERATEKRRCLTITSEEHCRKTLTDWVRRAMRFIDLCDADAGGYDDLHEHADRLTIDGYMLFGIPVEFEQASLAELEGMPLVALSHPAPDLGECREVLHEAAIFAGRVQVLNGDERLANQAVEIGRRARALLAKLREAGK